MMESMGYLEMMATSKKKMEKHTEEFLLLRRSQKQHFSSRLTTKPETKKASATTRSYPILS
jgi:hypothetical protein